MICKKKIIENNACTSQRHFYTFMCDELFHIGRRNHIVNKIGLNFWPEFEADYKSV